MSESFYHAPDTAHKAKCLGLETWGYAPNGDLRIAPIGSEQPTGTLSHEEIARQFEAQFALVPIRPRSSMVRVVRKS